MIRESSFNKSWPIIPLSDSVEFLDNRRKPVKASDRIEGEYSYYGANGFQGTINDYLFDEPLVLLAEDGGHFGNPDRDIAYIATGKYWVNNHAHVLKPKNGVDLNFLFRVLQRYDVSSFIKGATRAKLTKGDASRIPFPLPPLEEQKRIAAILDKADAIRHKRQQAIKLADDFLRSVFLDMFGDPVTNPKGWEVKPIKNGLKEVKSGWSAKGESYPCKKGVLGVLKISAVTSGVFKPSENKFVNKSLAEGRKLVFPSKGDLLFSRANTRELVAATCIVTESRRDVFLPDKLWKITSDCSLLLPEFLHFMIQQPRFKNLLTSQATGTSGSMLNISKDKFENSIGIYPPIDMQEEFKAVFWKVNSLLKSVKASNSKLNDGFNSLSQKAFAGEL